MALLMLIFCASAQNGIIKGIIKTSDGNPAESVSIVVKGTGKGALSDKEGTYTITNIKPGTYIWFDKIPTKEYHWSFDH